jgi:hypothetical protein
LSGDLPRSFRAGVKGWEALLEKTSERIKEGGSMRRKNHHERQFPGDPLDDNRPPYRPEPIFNPDLEVNRFFLDSCPMTRDGFDYLYGFGITEETILSMGVGFMEDTVHTFDLLRWAFPMERLKRAGFLDENDRFVFSEHQLVFPYFSNREPVYFRARTIYDRTPLEVDLVFPNHWIYNGDVLQFLKPGATVYVTKGPLETLEMLEVRCSLKSIPNFGIVGVLNYSPSSCDQLKRFRVVAC